MPRLSARALGAVLLASSACIPGLEEMVPFPCASDGTCPLGLACVEQACRAPALGGACQATTRCENAAPGGACVLGVCATVPAAPTEVEVRRVVDTIRVSWKAPDSNGGLPLLGYEVEAAPGLGAVVDPAATAATLPGVIEGTTYSVAVRALNAVGRSSPAGAPPLSISAPSVPGAPQSVVATAGARSASVTFAEPLDDGGRAIAEYKVTASPGGASVSVDAGTFAVTIGGLSPRVPHTFTVTATNEIGTGAPSSPSNVVTPTGLPPGAPTSVTATAGPRRATVSWVPPADAGDGPLLGYTITTNPGGTETSADAGATSAVITGLTPNTSYTFTVAARNAEGTGPASQPSAPVGVLPDLPGAPTNVRADAGPESATVTWSAPASDGGSVITGYVVTVSPGGARHETEATPTRLVVTDLAAGVAHTFTVAAKNLSGEGSPSSASAPVTPKCRPRFPSVPTAASGGKPVDVVTADFDGDGQADFAVAHGNGVSEAVVVYLGKGNGTFKPPMVVVTGGDGAARLATGDLNGDGRPDLVASVRGRGVGVILNTGNGTFAEAVWVGGNVNFGSLALADFDGDGHLDVAEESRMWWGNGTATLWGPTYPGSSASTWSRIAAGDFDKDGRPDLAALGSGGGVTVFLYNGSRTFKAGVNYSVVGPLSLLVLDDDGDGWLDLLVGSVNNESGELHLLKGSAGGAFGAALRLATFEGRPASLLVGDFDGDGLRDVVAVSGSGSHALHVLTKRTAGGYTKTFSLRSDVGANAAAKADFDGDGREDVLVSNSDTGTVSYYQGKADGTFVGQALHPSGGDWLFATAAADVTGDGRADAITVSGENSGQRSVRVVRGRGDGTVGAPEDTVPLADATVVAVGLLDGDATPDLVVNSPYESLTVMLSRGNGTFANGSYAAGGWVRQIRLVDLDRDGKLDIVACTDEEWGRVAVLLGNGDGTFRPRQSFPGVKSATSFTVADFDGDGHLDVVAADDRTTFIMLPGNGDGTFGSRIEQHFYDTPSRKVTALLGGRFDAGGRALLLVTRGEPGSDVEVFRYAGPTEKFTLLRTLALGPAALSWKSETRPSFVSGDFNGDGTLDFAVSNGKGNTISVFEGKGDGTFLPRADLPGGWDPRFLSAADFNGDGLDDLLFATGDKHLTVLAPACPK